MPGRPASVRSDDDDADDTVAEKQMEFARLQKKYRTVENDRKAYCQESQDDIKRQKAEIQKLEAEKEEILKDLRVIQSRSHQSQDDQLTEHLTEQSRTKLQLEQEIKEEKEKQVELKEENKKKERELRETKKTALEETKKGAKGQQGLTRLENQLQLANNNLCKALETNRCLREEINNLRVEGSRFEALYEKLDKRRQEQRAEMGEIIEQSTQAYEQREEAQNKMVLLKEKADKDLQAYNTEMKELNRIIDHDRKLRDFMNVKSHPVSEDKQMVAWRMRKEEQEAERKKASQTDTVSSYEAAFMRIRELRGDDLELNNLVNQFIACEDKNFALFQYVNAQNYDMEAIQEDIDKMMDDIRAFESQGVELESERRGILLSLEKRQFAVEEETQQYVSRLVEIGNILEQLRAGVDSLFGKANCDRKALDDMLGASDGVTDQNIYQYLGIIEERVNQLLMAHAYITYTQNYDEFSRRQPSLLGEGPSAPQQPAAIVPPSVGEDYDDGDSGDEVEEQRPLDRNELLNRAIKSVRKREAVVKRETTRYDVPAATTTKDKKDKRR